MSIQEIIDIALSHQFTRDDFNNMLFALAVGFGSGAVFKIWCWFSEARH